MASGKYILQELPNDGQRGPRLEIDEFLLDNDMTNLFLLALSMLQQDSLKPINGEMNLLNYYALAGIHGSPREKWSGVPNDVPPGYCHHSKDTFPTWHRPYMMLYETAIYLEMVKQAKLFRNPEDQLKYTRVAQRFRLPYWDPLMPRNTPSAREPSRNIWGLPRIFGQETVYLKTPSSPTEFTITDNPLWEFKFPTDFEKNGRQPLVQAPKFNSVNTVKCPDAKGVTDIKELDLRIQSQGNTMAVKLWQLLAAEDLSGGNRAWDSFATKLLNSSEVNSSGSIESWHDQYHGEIGPGSRGSRFAGQMGNPTIAGFEPMFWMHHNNIDRILSLYQALYGKNVEDQDHLATELRPFLKSETQYYTSNDDLVKNYWSPGFGVPGTRQINGIQKLVQDYLTDTYYWAVAGPNNKVKPLANWPKDLSGSEALYGSAAKSSTTTSLMELTSLALDEDEKPILVFQTAPVDQLSDTAAQTNIILHSSSILQSASKTNEVLLGNNVPLKPEVREAILSQVWDAQIKVRKYAFNGSFGIHVFIGYVKDDQTERFMTKKNEVGFFSIFATSQEEATGCEGCKKNQQDDIMIEDTVPLSNYLMDYLESNPRSEGLIRDGNIKKINSLEPDQVVPFLKEHLQWRMIDLQNTLLSGREQEARLEVTVTNRTFTAPSAENLMGIYGPLQAYEEITRDKVGGRGYVYPSAA